MSDVWVLVPLGAMALAFGTFWLVARYATERVRAQHTPHESYRRLAEAAVNGQQATLEETKRLVDSVKEVERLLREV